VLAFVWRIGGAVRSIGPRDAPAPSPIFAYFRNAAVPRSQAECPKWGGKRTSFGLAVGMANQDRLSLWFEGGDNFAQFEAQVSASGFSGETGYVVFGQHVRNFLDALARFPITDEITLEIGQEFPDGPLLVLAIGPADGRGTLRVRVSLAADDDRSRRVSTSFSCVYADVERFAQEAEDSLRLGGTAILTSDQS